MRSSASWKVPANLKRADLFSICCINVTKGRATGISCISPNSLAVFWFIPRFLLFQLCGRWNWGRFLPLSPSLRPGKLRFGSGRFESGAGAPARLAQGRSGSSRGRLCSETLSSRAWQSVEKLSRVLSLSLLPKSAQGGSTLLLSQTVTRW